MATTTNYGWTTPDDTALVKDGAAAIRTLGSSVDTTTKNLNPSTTLGDIEYRSSTANTNTRLGIGSTGQLLTVVGGVPAWAAAAGGGKLKQVVQATTTAFFSTNSTSYVDITGLSVSITPTANTSKIFAIWNSPTIYRGGGTNANNVGIKLVRGATDVFANDYLFNLAISGDKDGSYPYTMFFLDSPATTSATTYKLQMKNQNSYTSYWNYLGNATEVSSITLFEIGA